MFVIKKIWCRAFQTGFRIAMPILPYRKPEIIKSCKKLGEVLEKEKIKSVLIVTDEGILKSGIVSHVINELIKSKVKYTIYDKIVPNPTVENVEQALKLYLDNDCSCLIGIGGGSSIDCAKAVGARAVYPKRTTYQLKGVMKILRTLPTLIAIPTTAGTGSEVTPVSIITDNNMHHKYALMSFPLIPHYAVLDASLTYSLPKSLTATTGMDALTHAVEAYIGRSTSKETRKLALEATKLIFENIETAYNDGQNHKARENMILAAYKAGIAFSKSYVGYIHAVAHSLGGQYGIAHGLANTVLMPYLLKAYGKSVHKKLHKMAVAAGISKENEPYKESAEKFILEIEKLNQKMQIPNKLQGIKKEDIEIMAKHAEKEANPLYPVPKLMTRKELETFYYRVADWSEER